MIGVQLLITEDGTASWCTNRGLKRIAHRNILPPVQKSAEFQKRSLQVSKDLNEILPGSEIFSEPAEGFESPSVCLHQLLNGGKRRLVADSMEWTIHGH